MVVPIMLGGDFLYFIDMPALVLVVGMTIGAILMRHGASGFSQLLDVDNNEAVADTMGNAALLAGLIATPIAAIYLLSSYDGPKVVGPALAVSMLGTAYGYIIYAIGYFMSPKLTIKNASAVLLLAAGLVSTFFHSIIFAAFLPGLGSS
jgi:flagellar motor component MotA